MYNPLGLSVDVYMQIYLNLYKCVHIYNIHTYYQVELHRNKQRTEVSNSMWNVELDSIRQTTNLHTLQPNTNIY